MKAQTLFIVAQIFFTSFPVQAQPGNKNWETIIDLGRNAKLESINATSEGGFIVGGHVSAANGSADFFLLKIDASGRELWHQFLGGPEQDVDAHTIQTADGGYLIGGTTVLEDPGSRNSDDNSRTAFHVFRLNASGAIIWEKIIEGDNNDNVTCLLQAPDGGYVIGGNSLPRVSRESARGPNNDQIESRIIKLSQEGEIEWQRYLSGQENNFLCSMAPTDRGGILLGGTSVPRSSENIGLGTGTYAQYRIINLAADGEVRWDRTLEGVGDHFLSNAQQTPDGGYILAGFTREDLSTEPALKKHTDFQISKFTRNCVSEWEQTGVTDDDGCLTTLIQTLDGGYFLGGYIYCSGKETTGNHKEDRSFKMMKFSRSGFKEWEKKICQGPNASPYSVLANAGNTYVLAGCDRSEEWRGSQNNIKLTAFADRDDSYPTGEEKNEARILFCREEQTAVVTCGDGTIIERLELISSEGKMIYRVPVANNRYSIKTESIASGTYLINLTTNKGPRSLKLIVSH